MSDSTRSVATVAVAVFAAAALALNQAAGFVGWVKLSWPLLIACSLIIVYVVSRPHVIKWRSDRTYGPLKHVTSKFQPFATEYQTGTIVWQREKDLNRLLAKIEKHPSKHLLLSGQSGVGKSTLLRQLLPGTPSLKDWKICIVDSYEAAMSATLLKGDGWPSELVSKVWLSHAVEKTWMLNEFMRAEVSPDLLSIKRAIVSCVDAAPQTIFVFDQYERFLGKFEEALRTNQFDTQTVGFLMLLEALRARRSMRTIFAVRSDRYFAVLSLFDLLAASEASLTYMLLNGVDLHSAPDAAREIGRWLTEIHGAESHVQRMSRALGLGVHGQSNTFVTQVYGFIVSGYYQSDRRVRTMVQSGHRATEAIDIYLDVLANDFLRHTLGRYPKEFLVALMGCIAHSNSTLGIAVTATRISSLVYLPRDVVDDIVRFLLIHGVIVRETVAGDEGYRVIHEVLGDHILGSEDFAVLPIWKDGMEGLIEQRAPEESLTPATSFPNLFVDWLNPRSWTVLGLVSIWLFFAHAVLTINFRDACELSLSVLRLHSLEWFVGKPSQCAQYEWEHFIVLVPHMLWLWYIYDVTEGYLRKVLDGWRRTLSVFFPLIGAILAIVTAHYPQLMVVPIAAVGLLLGVVLILGCLSGEFIGRDRSITMSWGARTFINMSMALLSTFGLISLYAGTNVTADLAMLSLASWSDFVSSLYAFSGAAGGASLVLLAMSSVMAWFWFHIYPVQQSAVGAAARLAFHDRAQISRKLHESN